MSKKNKHNIFKEYLKCVKQYIKEEYKFILILFFLFIIFTWPVNYYIVVGGGISDIDSRVNVTNSYKSKGSFNISYVTELQGKIATYLLSYVVPDWERVSVDDYKYDKKEKLEDVEFRSDLDLKTANSTAIKYAYMLANKEIKTIDTHIYVVVLFDEYKSNLKIQDELININGNSFKSISEYKSYLQQFNKGDTVNVLIKRGKKEINVDCPIYEYKGVKILGVSLQTYSNYKTDPKVSFAFNADESGPSGGIITTLDIYNKLTKKDLTKGLKIAGTGTIEDDGSAGTIGGVNYKLLGAVKGGADVFLVPSGENYKDCVKLKKKKNFKIKLIEIKSIEDAINKLNKLK